MAVIKVSLDKRKIKKDNTYPVCLRIYYGNKSTTRSTKINVSEKHWDDKTKTVRKSHPSANILNKILLKHLADLQSELLFADDQKVKEFLAPKATEEVKPIVSKPSVYSFAYER